MPTERTQRRLSKAAKPVDKRLYKNYLQKSEEMLDVARYAANTSKNNAAVASSVHCAINAIDALAVFYLGRRMLEGTKKRWMQLGVPLMKTNSGIWRNNSVV